MGDLVAIGLFMANYAFVAPMSAIAGIVGFVGRNRRRPTYLAPIGAVNALVAGGQLALVDVEWWLRALLGAQLLAGIALIVWVLRAKPKPSASP